MQSHTIYAMTIPRQNSDRATLARGVKYGYSIDPDFHPTDGYLETIQDTQMLWNTDMKPYIIYRTLPLPVTLSDLHNFFLLVS